MAIPVKFYRFSKKENSTKRPGNADKTYSCTIKSGIRGYKSPDFIKYSFNRKSNYLQLCIYCRI